jgi:hypothetical protein
MAQTALIAQITGEAYRHMLDWRHDIDLQLIPGPCQSPGAQAPINASTRGTDAP